MRRSVVAAAVYAARSLHGGAPGIDRHRAICNRHTRACPTPDLGGLLQELAHTGAHVVNATCINVWPDWQAQHLLSQNISYRIRTRSKAEVRICLLPIRRKRIVDHRADATVREKLLQRVATGSLDYKEVPARRR